MFQNLHTYKLLCIFRVALVLMPQTGYIHPDEHFQGPEITYGDIVGYKVLRTWEFTSTEPVRSIFYPYAITVLPAIVIKLLTWLQCEIGSYLLLILPRLIMCAFSFLQDICIYYICVTTRTNYRPSLVLFASSYITLVYFTRTFSNSLESIFFAYFLLLLFKSIKLYQKLTDKEISYVFSRQFIFCSFMCGVTLSLGIFNRPTFICYSAFPVIIWLLIFYKVDTYSKINIFISFLLGVISVSICLAAVDSFYYNKINSFSIDNFKVIYTPLNFILYNLNSTNLNNHGLHPRWLHIFANIPLLFSIYGIVLLFYFIRKVYDLFFRLEINIEMLILLSFFTPLVLLSIIPHQEPRFLVPLIVPLSLIYNGPHFRTYISKNFYIFIWISSNILLALFYGFIHQAGIYLSVSYLNSQINDCTVIFYKTYMPPRYLLSLKESDKNTSVYDFAGVKFDEFESEVQNIITSKNPSKVFIVLPYKVLNTDITFEALTMSNFKFVERLDLFPHISTENLPDFRNIWHIFQTIQSYRSMLYDLKEMFSIQIIVFRR